MFKLLGRAGLLIVTFCVTFLLTTALCDWMCWHSGYYDEAAKETVVLED